MIFTAKTDAPVGKTKEEQRQDKIKSLLFEAVLLCVENNENVRQELLDLLGVPNEPADVMDSIEDVDPMMDELEMPLDPV